MARLPSTTTPSAPPSEGASSSQAAHGLGRMADNRAHAATTALPPLSQSNPSAVSLEPSTARGQSIPLAHDTAVHRTTALRELSRSQPTARPRYARTAAAAALATTAKSYSQPILVRTYPPSSPAHAHAHAHAAASSARRAPRSVASHLSHPSHPSTPARGRRAFAVALVRPRLAPAKNDDVALPPLDAFTFKSIMADIEHDVATDLDRIAEICARSRYSLSNQYEIHVAPHGSGAAFAPRPAPRGPTLQAISSDDEHASASAPARHPRRPLRRSSAAYGTLETIMSSSRSSDDERSNRKSAADIAAHVRGRHGTHGPDEAASADSTEAQPSSDLHAPRAPAALDRSPRTTTFAAAILRRSSLYRSPLEPPTAVLVGRPTRAETSHSHLMSTAAAADARPLDVGAPRPAPQHQPSSVVLSESVAAADIAAPAEPRPQSGLLAAVRFTMPWKGARIVSGPSAAERKAHQTDSYAEDTLRNLLRGAEPVSRESKSPGGESDG